MLPLGALLLITAGGLLEVAGVAFAGLDLVIGLCFGGGMIVGGASALKGRFPICGLIACGVAALALGLHLCLNLGVIR